MFFNKRKKRIKAIKSVLKSWIEGNIEMAHFLKIKSRSDLLKFIKTDWYSIWFFIGSSDSLSQREELIRNEDFLKLTKEVFNEMGFSKDIYTKCIDSYVDNSWSSDEFEHMMLGGQCINDFYQQEKDDKAMMVFGGSLNERLNK